MQKNCNSSEKKLSWKNRSKVKDVDAKNRDAIKSTANASVANKNVESAANA